MSITEEQVDGFEQHVEGYVYIPASDVKVIIAALRAERAAHQATKAELEQLRARLELIPAMAKEHESKGANDPFALATGIALRHVYAALKGIEISDAARAGQEASE